jgi:hypothetical protein
VDEHYDVAAQPVEEAPRAEEEARHQDVFSIDDLLRFGEQESGEEGQA